MAGLPTAPSAGGATDCDLLVVGAGAGGMTAALSAARRGLRVVLCEATAQVGGTTATSAGTLWVPAHSQGVQAGQGDSIEAAARYLEALIGPDDPRGLRRRYLDEGPRVMAEIESCTRLRFVSAGTHPDYVELPGRALAGRALSPVEFDGRELGRADFARVRAPLRELLVLGGMMANKADVQALFQRWRSRRGFMRSAQLAARFAVDRLRYPRGTRLVLGNALVARLLASLRDAQVDIRFQHRLLDLQREGDAVTGAVFEHEGQRVVLRAGCGVVLATGGIGHDTRLRAALAGKGAAHPHSLACESVRGEGIAAARSAGASLERHPKDFLWQPVSRVPHADGSTGLFPHLYLDRAKPGLIAVGRNGQRFVDEGCSYHHFVEAQNAALGADAPAWLVCDSAFVERYGIGMLPPGKPGRQPSRQNHARTYLQTAATLAELAAQLGIDAAALARTVAEHNQAARSGEDLAFKKGQSAVSRFNGDATHTPNPCLGRIERGPFCALAVHAADAASSSGLATDADGSVLDDAGHAIADLYACGNDMASVFRGAYPGPGATLGPALVFGWLVGAHAGLRVSRQATRVKAASGLASVASIKEKAT